MHKRLAFALVELPQLSQFARPAPTKPIFVQGWIRESFLDRFVALWAFWLPESKS